MMKRKKAISLLLAGVMVATMFVDAPVVYAQGAKMDKQAADRYVQAAVEKTHQKQGRLAGSAVANVSTYAQLQAALAAKTPNIYLLQDMELEDVLTVDYSVSFLAPAAGKTLYAAPGKRHIEVTAPDVQLQFSHVVLDGRYVSGNTEVGGINVPVSGVSIIGAVIQNIRGEAVLNDVTGDNVSFAIYDTVIRSSDRSDITSTARDVVIYNTEITACTDCGIYVLSGDDDRIAVYLYDSVIQNNAGYSAVWVENVDLMINENTIISGNTTDEIGAGVCANASDVVSYGEISHNTSKKSGGGIALLENSSLTMEGGAVSFNTGGRGILDSGGGIYLEGEKSQVTINNGVIEGNTAANGGAIGVKYTVNIVGMPIFIHGGTIRKNGFSVDADGNVKKMSSMGGGIFGNSVTMTDGVVEQNLCSNEGCGIYAAAFNMQGGMIQDNGYYETDAGETVTTKAQGGGVWTKDAVIFGGYIYGNMAQYGGSMAVFGTLNLSAPAYIRYNTATEKGGGLYYKSLGEADLSRIKNNTAPQGSNYALW